MMLRQVAAVTMRNPVCAKKWIKMKTLAVSEEEAAKIHTDRSGSTTTLSSFLLKLEEGALYCVCKDGVGDQALQKVLDYACGAGADCTPLLQNGACYNPKTVKDHCSYAVNSYFQKKGQAQGSCDFSGAATTTQTAPASSSGCVYPSSARYAS
ncbi:hypothetical protein QN277_004058 [Acacia crassicarpa]|uniref:X8 domain-containing protein n=1 Tax=Acacia crassicarpa TaxID=499986 RepID=A0AAE1J253_9FABA|nr:hypothetical protein QN277_004058 [Acacia crassicarpa]